MPTPELTLRLVRHGQTHGNVAGALDTAFPGAELTALGVRQAVAAAEVLRHEHSDALFVSPLTRTHQTMAPLAARLDRAPVQLAGLTEVSAGELEGRTDDDALAVFRATVIAWLADDLQVPMPGGETGAEFVARYDDAIAAIAAQVASGATGGVATVVSHGTAIRTWSALRAVHAPDRGVLAKLDNTGCVTLAGHPGTGWRVLDWRGTPLGGHLLADHEAADPTATLLG